MSSITQQYLDAKNAACAPLIPGLYPSYGYTPSEGAGIAFVVIFSVMGIIHTALAVWKREWWCLVFSVGALCELIGWSARLWAAICPYNGTAFLMQISTLIFAPTFFIAGIYIILKRFVDIMGRQYSPINPNLYLWIFCTCDFVSLLLQAVGGGLASAESDVVGGNTKIGTSVMVSGIVFQLASLSAFVYFFVLFLVRTRKVKVPRAINLLTFATTLSLMAVYVRSVYRTIELLQGWSGYLITHEIYFVVLDGVMVTICGGIFIFFNPGVLLKTGNVHGGLADIEKERSESKDSTAQDLAV